MTCVRVCESTSTVNLTSEEREEGAIRAAVTNYSYGGQFAIHEAARSRRRPEEQYLKTDLIN